MPVDEDARRKSAKSRYYDPAPGRVVPFVSHAGEGAFDNAVYIVNNATAAGTYQLHVVSRIRVCPVPNVSFNSFKC